MRVAGVIRDSLVNGNGLRDVVFVQGCNHHCKGCQNPQTWNIAGGKEIHPIELARMFTESPNDITISGGEPYQQWVDVWIFITCVLQDSPNKRFWVYTGNMYDEHIRWITERFFWPWVEVVVDGEFKEELKDPNCLYRGSSNQRLIDVNRSLITKNIVLWEGANEA